jgi:predicted glycosyltransferase involved in capsule biosynthesis
MIDLTYVTFMIPVRIESEDRKINLSIVVDYLLKHYQTNIIIYEQDITPKVPSFFKAHWHPHVRHVFFPSDSKFFHKTRALNLMTKMSTTPVVISYDSDIIFPVNQLVDAASCVYRKIKPFCYPFNTRLYHIEKNVIPIIRDTLDLAAIGSNTTERHPGVPPGGAFVIDKATFFQCGLENEHFISWGPEDQERVYRVTRLGHPVEFINGPIFHLDHSRTPNSNATHEQFARNEAEFMKIRSMSVGELRNYIGTWAWTR